MRATPARARPARARRRSAVSGGRTARSGSGPSGLRGPWPAAAARPAWRWRPCWATRPSGRCSCGRRPGWPWSSCPSTPGPAAATSSACSRPSARDLAGDDDEPPAQLLRVLCWSGAPPDGWLPLRRLTGEAPPAAVVLVLFTSGTTGAPKGCPHTGRNLAAQTHDFDPKRDASAVDRWLVHTPVSYMLAVNNALRAWRGGDAVVFASPAFDAAASAAALAHDACTVTSATPTLVRALLARGAAAPAAGRLAMVTMAGTRVGPPDVALCRRALGARDVVQAYGMSEGGPLVSWARRNPLFAAGRHPGVGKVLPGGAVRVCAPGARRVLARGLVGELHVGSPSVVGGYLGGVDAASFYSVAGSWLVTGDMGSMDRDGVLHLEGRVRDLIIRGGENVHPAAIESALAEVPGLQMSAPSSPSARRSRPQADAGTQSQVVGVPDVVAGHLAVAVVGLPSGFCKARVADKARSLGPSYTLDAVYTLDELGLPQMPVTSLGKPRKGLLQEAVVRLRASSSRPHEESELQTLSDALASTWEQLTGHCPSPEHRFSRFADSITLLRYCDGVLRFNGRRLYRQDLMTHDTVRKQARLLLDRKARRVPPGLSCSSAGVQHGGLVSAPEHEPAVIWAAATRRAPPPSILQSRTWGSSSGQTRSPGPERVRRRRRPPRQELLSAHDMRPAATVLPHSHRFPRSACRGPAGARCRRAGAGVAAHPTGSLVLPPGRGSLSRRGGRASSALCAADSRAPRRHGAGSRRAVVGRHGVPPSAGADVLRRRHQGPGDRAVLPVGDI